MFFFSLPIAKNAKQTIYRQEQFSLLLQVILLEINDKKKNPSREGSFNKVIYPSGDANLAAKVLGFALSPYSDNPAL